MPGRASVAASVVSAVSALLSVLSLPAFLSAPGCKEKPTYDDAPIGRIDRKKKVPEPPETFEVEKICASLVDLPSAGVDPTQKSDLREMCRSTLVDLQKTHPDEYACRCKCIQAAGDLFAVERCTRYCSAEDPDRVCDHVVGVENDSGDAGVLADAHDACVKDLKKLHEKDPARWTCTVRCLVGATAKDDALACNGKCGGGPAAGDAGAEAGPTKTGAGALPVPQYAPIEIE
jgi:hypothetical protein